MEYFFLFVLGTIFASFLNALMYRIEANMQIKKMLFTRSHCDTCKRELVWMDLFPILSWLSTRGKCRYCKEQIPIYYPVSEFILGISFIIIYQYQGLNLWVYLVTLFLFAMTYSDFYTKGIPKNLVHFFLILSLAYTLLNLQSIDMRSILYAVLLGIFILIANSFKKVFGLGDVLIILGISVFLDLNVFLNFLILTVLIGGLYGLIVSVKDIRNLKKYIPLVPFIYIAWIMSLVFANLNFVLSLV